jgi:hypothetical protein
MDSVQHCVSKIYKNNYDFARYLPSTQLNEVDIELLRYAV